MSLKLPSPRKAATRRAAPSGPTASLPSGENAAVIATNDDAAACKRSCVALGYFEDPFLPFLVREAGKQRQTAPNGNNTHICFARKSIRLIEILLHIVLMTKVIYSCFNSKLNSPRVRVLACLFSSPSAAHESRHLFARRCRSSCGRSLHWRSA